MKILLAVFFLAWSSLVWSATLAGKIDFIEGDVRITDSQSKERPAKLGDLLSEGDTLITGTTGEVHVAMEDGGQLALHPTTRLRVLKYKAEGGKTDTSVLNLLQGALRSVTGWIGKYNPKNYEIRTPTATIGVRGTDHETRVIAEGSPEAPAGTYDKVNIGATQMRTPYGVTEIRAHQAGFASPQYRTRPRLLEHVPTIFRPLKNEQRFEGLHDRIRQHLEKNRSQRIQQVIEQRKAARDASRATLKNERQQKRTERQAQREQRKAARAANRAGHPEKSAAPPNAWEQRQKHRTEPGTKHEKQRTIPGRTFQQPSLEEPKFGRSHGRKQ